MVASLISRAIIIWDPYLVAYILLRIAIVAAIAPTDISDKYVPHASPAVVSAVNGFAVPNSA
tara:strand:- start:7156 stop:7341 length:186 start_codon:yes stop_codon:yes gene_type:complete